MSAGPVDTPTSGADADERPLTPDEWRGVKVVVQAALEIPREAREAFVVDACADNLRMRREVLSLLDSPDTDPGDDAFLAPPVPNVLAALDLDALATDPGDGALAPLWRALADRYAVERRIGRGGMATVHLARDLRHDRPVAIKVLHPRLATVLGRERFLREIALTASLRHPNLLPLFDSGSEAGQLWFVMPFIDGETLRARLARAPLLSVEDAVALAGEIAGALAHAHARGIVHRDIKPENILLEPAGQPGARPRALVADFGIARAIEDDAGPLLTRTGFAIGTPRYMAPEQARGVRDVDARADVYALGAVLHEMLAGEPPYSAAAVRRMAAGEAPGDLPALTTLRPGVPPHVVQAVTTALALEPDARFADASAFAAALVAPVPAHVPAPEREPARATASVAPDAPHDVRHDAPHDLPVAVDAGPRVPPLAVRDPAPLARRTLVGTVAATLAIGAFVGWQGERVWSGEAFGALGGMLRRGAVAPPAAADGTQGFVVEAGAMGAEVPSLAPDGSAIVFRHDDGTGVPRLYSRRVARAGAAAGDDALVPRALDGTAGATSPFHSADGAWVGYVADGALRRTNVAGGASAIIATLPAGTEVAGATWSAGDEIVLADRRTGTLLRVDANDGTVTPVRIEGDARRLRDPSFVPGRRAVLVTIEETGGIGVVDLERGVLREIGRGIAPRIADGRLVYATGDGTLCRTGWDTERLEAGGAGEVVARGVAVVAGRPLYTAAVSGAIAYRTIPASAGAAVPREQLQLTVRDRDGRVVQRLDARIPWTPRFSPDGRSIAQGAAPDGDGRSELWVTSLADGTTRQLTRDGADANDPQWSPDGRLLAYSATQPGAKRVLVQPVAGGAAVPLAHSGRPTFPTGWTPDGRTVLATEERGGDQDILALPADGGPARVVVATSAREGAARVSPDGRWIAYQSDAGGRTEIWIASYPDGARRTRLTTGGGVHPVWQADGRALYYREGARLLVMPVTRSRNGALEFGAPTPVLRARYPETLFAMYDVSPDGRRVVVSAGPVEDERLVIVPGGTTAPR